MRIEFAAPRRRRRLNHVGWTSPGIISPAVYSAHVPTFRARPDQPVLAAPFPDRALWTPINGSEPRSRDALVAMTAGDRRPDGAAFPHSTMVFDESFDHRLRLAACCVTTKLCIGEPTVALSSRSVLAGVSTATPSTTSRSLPRPGSASVRPGRQATRPGPSSGRRVSIRSTAGLQINDRPVAPWTRPPQTVESQSVHGWNRKSTVGPSRHGPAPPRAAESQFGARLRCKSAAGPSCHGPAPPQSTPCRCLGPP